AGHRLQARLRRHRRHPDDRVLQPHRRQPRAVRLRDGGDAVDGKDHPDAARAHGQDLGHRPGSREVGAGRRASGQPQCRPVRAADAERARRQGARDGRPDRRRRAAQYRGRRRRLRHAYLRRRGRHRARHRPRDPLHRGAGRRPRHPPGLCRGPAAGR
ncbi:hypothetical protein KXW36_001166, partial [Aspergillus fumigatus]